MLAPSISSHERESQTYKKLKAFSESNYLREYNGNAGSILYIADSEMEKLSDQIVYNTF